MKSVVVIKAPTECDWINLPMKDRRKKGIWLCRVCGAKSKALHTDKPLCQCVDIEIKPIN